jgi:hypothetical protein
LIPRGTCFRKYARSFNAGILPDPPRRPAQSPKGYDLLFLFFRQDVTHIAEGKRPRVGINVLDYGLSLAGFEVIIDGRRLTPSHRRAESIMPSL